ncbi:YciI family protein [Falsibacillus albus]|uniref:YCII-related domain-containing protein n=1 Tax=Falsibacillus albus TaxID=2478915 RepID=A0A3L7K498_9BACI|nr:YciI family protein [Falsibacillus albus]RLQ97485.1 hypothetical protein D9X91_04860 [Falsibacillus albus]
MREQYVYILKLIPELLNEENWTEKENGIVAEHFEALQELKADGKLILAGRTLNMDETTFGLAVFEADSEQQAKEIMESDPAVKKGIMTATLFPYRVALFSEANISK